MEYRVYDTKQNCWVLNNIYLSPSGELYEISKSFLGIVKLSSALNEDRYIYHRAIDLNDKYGTLIFEGDYIKAHVSEDKTVIGIVAFAQELAGYVILCDETDEFYMLGTDICEMIEVVGNVFDGTNEGEQDGYEAL